MMRFRSIMTMSGLVFLSQCNQKPSKLDSVSIKLPAGLLSHSSAIYGEWEDNSVFMYSANLVFHKNGTFDFNDVGCTGSSYSKGNWVMGNGLIVLTSFDEFDKSKIQRAPSSVVLKGQASKKNNYAETTWELDTSIAREEFKFYRRDSAPVYFYKRKFVLKGDTLFGVNTASKFSRQ